MNSPGQLALERYGGVSDERISISFLAIANCRQHLGLIMDGVDHHPFHVVVAKGCAQDVPSTLPHRFQIGVRVNPIFPSGTSR